MSDMPTMADGTLVGMQQTYVFLIPDIWLFPQFLKLPDGDDAIRKTEFVAVGTEASLITPQRSA
jgi:hypothetical protein